MSVHSFADIFLLYDPAILLLDFHPKEIKTRIQNPVQTCFIHDSTALEKAQVPIDRINKVWQ